jgi:magnesium chelatase family protein
MSSLLSHIYSAGLIGIDAYLIDVELHISLGLPTWNTVGLPESAVKESKDRVISAVHTCEYEFPYRKITINLAPADIKKEGTAYDLPIAIGLLSAAGLLPQEVARSYLIVGELSLTGKVRKIRGALSIALLARDLNMKGVIVPAENYGEASVVEGIEVLGAQNLPQVVEFLTLGTPIPIPEIKRKKQKAKESESLNLAEVRGQAYAKRALEIAAAGFHNVLLQGPPGTGKTMLASRLASILPEMSFEESLTTTKIYSLMGLTSKDTSLVKQRPFRSPHHTISDAGLIGGGSHPKPGEVSLAHNGVLFLDELTEFHRNVLESLRQPLESGKVTIARASQSITYPARFLLAAAMNPCPCGHYGNPQGQCHCTVHQLRKYQTKISGPLLDRIDLRVEVPSVTYEELTASKNEEDSELVRMRVTASQQRQEARLKEHGLRFNSQMGPRRIKETCKLDESGQKILETAMKKWQLSARAFDRTLRVARTIADLKGEEVISSSSVTEAVQYRLG